MLTINNNFILVPTLFFLLSTSAFTATILPSDDELIQTEEYGTLRILVTDDLPSLTVRIDTHEVYVGSVSTLIAKIYVPGPYADSLQAICFTASDFNMTSPRLRAVPLTLSYKGKDTRTTENSIICEDALEELGREPIRVSAQTGVSVAGDYSLYGLLWVYTR